VRVSSGCLTPLLALEPRVVDEGTDLKQSAVRRTGERAVPGLLPEPEPAKAACRRRINARYEGWICALASLTGFTILSVGVFAEHDDLIPV